jgi:hypothetical protein
LNLVWQRKLLHKKEERRRSKYGDKQSNRKKAHRSLLRKCATPS